MVVLGGFLVVGSLFLIVVYRDQIDDDGLGGRNARLQTRISRVTLIIGAVLLVLGAVAALVT